MTTTSTMAYTGGPEAEDIVRWGMETFGADIALACSFSVEDIVVIDMMKRVRGDIRVFAIDTGRLNEETYECAESVRRHFEIDIAWYFPRHEAVEALERAKGMYSFRTSLENRRECCGIRKVEPLGRALRELKAWITGMRREQSMTRATIAPLEPDGAHGGIAKLNPLADWTVDDVWKYVRAANLPYNRLHDSGYPSIGCAPCTRAVKAGEDPRAGRWWWEREEHKECGLHFSI